MRAAELEVLITANDRDVARAEKAIKATGDRVEKNPLKLKADEADALAGMDRVEQAAKRIVSQATVATVDANIDRGEKNLTKVQERLDYLRSVETELDVTAEVRRAEANLSRVERNLAGLRAARATMEVDADVTDAVDGVETVEKAAKRLVSQGTALRVNANVATAQASIDSLVTDLDYLRSLGSSGVKVDADVAKAEAKLAGARAALRDLEGARAEMVVDVNEGGIRRKLSDVADFAGESGASGGKQAGAALVGGIVGALATIPIAGALAGIAHTVADTVQDAFRSGLSVEARQDRLQGLTGIDERTAGRLARVAAESYASNFGESIEANMDTTRLALQFRLIDSETTNRDARAVVDGLAGVADVLGEEVRPAGEAVAVMLRTGISKSARDAFDVLAAGAREGVNRSEDLLDTFIEYPALFSRLGLDAETSMGLLNQGLREGARNSDLVADALKEFQIRATDASTASAEGFKALGLDAEEMTAKISRGGQDARDGLDLVLTRLRETEDPVLRNAAAVALFGTQAEDLGDALFALDPKTAVDGLNGVQGAAQRMFDTIASNDKSKIDQAFRNVEVAVQGIQGILASGFSEPLAQAAEYVTKNRGPVLEFFLDMVNGALDFGEAIVEGTAAGTEAVGEFVSGPLADLAQGLGKFIGIFDITAGQDLVDFADQMRDFDDTTKATADSIRDLGNGAIEEARAKVAEFGEGAVAMGYLNDASLRLADTLSLVGTNGQGAALSLEGVDLANLGASESGLLLEQQILNAAAALEAELSAAERAGEGQSELTNRYNSARSALIDQIVQMGIGKDAAGALVDQILRTPSQAT
ncbi:MAG: hypothetical protein FJW64_05020, partial [Actinobacteria bacterium]|nr:hypothetical protein [Actinomycetota bacterium]